MGGTHRADYLCLVSSTPIKMSSLGVALFGLGRAGQIHFGNLVHNPRFHLLYVVDADESKAKQLVDDYHLAGRTTPLSADDAAAQVWRDSRVVAVIVATPTYAHEPLIRNALESGKHVFCEKPIATTEDAVIKCYDLADKVGKILLCSFNRRFDPANRRLFDAVRAGKIGTVHVIKTCSRDSPFPPLEYLKISGGIFHDCLVHDIDLICWILGCYPESVYSIGHTHVESLRQLNDADTVVTTMKFPNNVLATIDISRNSAYGYDQRVEIFGQEGMIRSENQRQTELEFFGSLTERDASGARLDKMKFSFPQRYAESYVDALVHFADAVEGKIPGCCITKEETVSAGRIATLAERSWRENKVLQFQ